MYKSVYIICPSHLIWLLLVLKGSGSVLLSHADRCHSGGFSVLFLLSGLLNFRLVYCLSAHFTGSVTREAACHSIEQCFGILKIISPYLCVENDDGIGTHRHSTLCPVS